MHILVDLRWMKPGYSGGIETQSRAFLQTVLEMDYSNSYTVLIPSEARFDFDLTGHRNITFINCDGPSYFLNRLFHKSSPPLPFESRPPVIAGHPIQCDVALSLAGYTQPDLLGLPTLLVVPDIQHEYFPQYFSTVELENRKKAFTTSILRSRTICAISNFTRQTLIEKLNVAPNQIVVTPLAVDLQIAQPVQENVLAKYNLAPGYLFYPAATWPHKNHCNLIQALRLLRDRNDFSIDLVCTGAAKEAQNEIDAAVQQFGLTKQVHFLGFIPQEDLGSLYRNAAMLVFPSLFEGFGMPLLEAMACGCPVVCSHSTSLPEVGGDAALYFDPLDPQSIAQTILAVARNEPIRSGLIERGRLRVQTFSWKRFTLQILQQAYRITCSSQANPDLPEIDAWDSSTWQAILFPSQPMDFKAGEGQNLWGRFTSAHHRFAIHLIHATLDASRRRQPILALGLGLCASILSPRAAWISMIFPPLRDIFRKIRSQDHV